MDGKRGFSMEINAVIQEFGFDCKIRKLSPKTIENYQKQLTYLQRYEKRKRHIGIDLFRFHDSARGQTVEIPIPPDNEIDYTIFDDKPLDSLKQPIVYALRYIPVADKEAGFHG